MSTIPSHQVLGVGGGLTGLQAAIEASETWQPSPSTSRRKESIESEAKYTSELGWREGLREQGQTG